ncbi:hypothetical protein AMECASPLE_021411 [Ameca splendens]|uniref:Uncharacterized protein n=1 Tax=Ameca splendens TaxID=208324 RepID=A0ABV0ZZ74_9TELE
MKGHTNFLSAVHRESICLTPDTFHSASCPTRAVDATSNFSPQILTSNTWKVTNRNPHKICTLSKCLSGLKKVFFLPKKGEIIQLIRITDLCSCGKNHYFLE